MRMWMVNPKIMCRQHLLGEHLELHMFIGSLNKKTNLQGFANKGLLEIKSLFQRHEDIVKEMISRGYKHNSPMETNFEVPINIEDSEVDKEKSLELLINKCPECKRLLSELDKL